MITTRILTVEEEARIREEERIREDERQKLRARRALRGATFMAIVVGALLLMAALAIWPLLTTLTG